MNTVFSFLVPLFCWASYGLADGISPAKTARRLRRNWLRPLGAAAGTPAMSSAAEPTPFPFQLKWAGRDSFFDPAVQEILKERHPAQLDPARAGFKGFAIDAWSAVDQFARTAGSSDRSLAEFGVFMRLDRLWTSRLLAATVQAQSRFERTRFRSPDAVAAENRRREQLMIPWAECWIAHYRLAA